MALYHNAMFVSTKDQFPQEEHWAIIKFSSVHIPGDERSRTHPGHGYPAHDERVVHYEAFLDRNDWIAAISELEKDRSGSYVAVKVSGPAKPMVKVTVPDLL